MGNPLSPHASRSTKLGNRLKLENPDLSHAGVHSEILKNVENMPPPSSGIHQKQQIERKFVENEELVKYMSNLPSYLEKGEKLQEKALNVGVLDWRRLEKWQYNQKQVPHRSIRYSPSSSNTSSFSSTDGSSTHSSRGHSCSPAHQRMHRPTLQSHLYVSPKEAYSHGDESFVENIGKFQDLTDSLGNPIKGQKNVLRTNQSFNKNPVEIKLKECNRKDSGQQRITETKTSQGSENYGVGSRSKGKMKIQDGESTKGPEGLHDQEYDMVSNICPERHKTVVLLPRDGPENSHSVISQPSDSEEINGQKSKETSQRRFSDGFYHTELYSNIPHSCSLPSEVDRIKNSQVKQHSSIDAKSIKFSSGLSKTAPHSAKVSVSPSRGKSLEEKKSIIMPTNSTVFKSSGPDLKMGTLPTTNMRNVSPTRRFSIGMGRTGRSSSSKDTATMPQLSSKLASASASASAKSGLERVEDSTCSDNSTSDNTNASNRARSSPLRRLLDPLLKPKAANSNQFAEPSQKAGQRESSTVHPMRVKLDLTRCMTINVDDSHCHEKHGSSTVQALLQITAKNGLPLFTFAVENNSDILAATMRKLSSSRKDENGWIYTFFTIREMKKKNGSWLNQGGKGKGQGYIPNVVAQMKVSDSSVSNLSRQHFVDQHRMREFVLFSMDLRQADQTLNQQPNDELAAIVVNFPRKTTRDLNQCRQQSNKLNDLSEIGHSQSSPNLRGYSHSRKSEDTVLPVSSQDLFNTTVILPGGVHGLPSKGEPSSLIERWKSGGCGCDCGGWDLGCGIRVLANETQHGKRSALTRAYLTTDQFDLFSQGEVPDNRPVFSMSPFKDKIFAVEFNSSLSLLQAFAICIAVLNSRKPSVLSELSNFGEESSEETILLENAGIKPPNQVQVEVPFPCGKGLGYMGKYLHKQI